MKFTRIILILSIFISACNNENTIETIQKGSVTLNFTHNWDGENISSSDFITSNYTNANGEVMNISKLKYLISAITLHQSNGVTVPLTSYMLVDLTNDKTSVEILEIPFDTYSSISFTFGFNEIDNIDGAYTDLNSASWNWPAMLGGGYHFMQFEGKYHDGTAKSPYAYHMGTAKKDVNEFEQNFFDVALDGFTMTDNVAIEIKMNVAEWFKNPNLWDLKVHNINLMPNYEAQKLMNQNGRSVFSLGEVTH